MSGNGQGLRSERKREKEHVHTLDRAFFGRQVQAGEAGPVASLGTDPRQTAGKDPGQDTESLLQFSEETHYVLQPQFPCWEQISPTPLTLKVAGCQVDINTIVLAVIYWGFPGTRLCSRPHLHPPQETPQQPGESIHFAS